MKTWKYGFIFKSLIQFKENRKKQHPPPKNHAKFSRIPLVIIHLLTGFEGKMRFVRR